MRYYIGIDQSTQGTKALLVDNYGTIIHKTFLPHSQIINSNGWISHDPMEIYNCVINTVKQLISDSKVPISSLVGVGITNQRETSLAWNRITGEVAENAIVWQCSRAVTIVDSLQDEKIKEEIYDKTGIPLSPYFPASKMSWLLKNNLKVQKWSQKNELCFGTIDSWLIYKLTNGKQFYTDYSNASRTQLYNIQTKKWDEELCKLFSIPINSLPEVIGSDSIFGFTSFNGFIQKEIPICAILGDSQAALFAQDCLLKGMTKATLGTGSSVMMNIGSKFQKSHGGLVTSIAWKINDIVDYVFEGNINYCGSILSWFCKDLQLIESPELSSQMALEANLQDTTCLIPAFSGLGAPYWDNNVRAMICGMSRTTGKKEIIRAGLDSIAFQIADIIKLMSNNLALNEIQFRVDGGPTSNNYLMQLLANVLNQNVFVSSVKEASAYGVISLVAKKNNDVLKPWDYLREYYPQHDKNDTNVRYLKWKQAIECAMSLHFKGAING